MQGESHSKVLKRSPARSVRLDAAGDGRPLVVKRFRSDGRGGTGSGERAGAGLLGAVGALRGLRDGARARNEFALLSRLHAAGAPVPRPVELRRAAGGGYEVTMEWFPDAVTLLDLLAGAHPPPRPPRELAAELARLLAGFQARGLDHPDLHAGNLLVGPGGELVMIDFHKARLERALGASALEAQLVQLAAGAREFVSRPLRRRFLRAWRAALTPELAGRLERAVGPGARGERALARRVERSAVRLRRGAVLRRRERWTRAGTAVEPLEPGRGWRRRDVDPARVAALLARASPEGPAAADRGPALDLLLRDLDERELLAIWRVAARLHEHRLPCAAPLALGTGPRTWVALELPAGARPARADERPAARARLAARLADRGLEAALEDRHLYLDAAGRPLAVALSELRLA